MRYVVAGPGCATGCGCTPGERARDAACPEQDYIALIDGMHHLVNALIVLVWDRLNTHVSHVMRDLIDARD